MRRFPLLSAVAALPWTIATPTPSPHHVTVLTRDVAVIGGGASGTYAAIRLQEQGKSVALIEKEARLGGHVNTYTDPATNQTVDYGVQIFSNLTVLRNFFEHFDIPLVPVSFADSIGASETIDFLTGETVPGSIDELAVGEALLGYAAQLAKYPGIESKWDLTYPVAEDLLLNFGDFMEKYNLTAMAAVAFSYNQGIGNILAQPTLYVMKYFSALLVSEILSSGFVRNGLSDNQLLYNRAQAELGDNAFLSSEVVSTTRNAEGVEVTIRTSEGWKRICASKLLLAIPPKASNLRFLDLDQNEYGLFSQFNNSYYWDAVVKNTGLPDDLGVSNADPLAALGIPAMPASYGLSATAIPNTKLMYYSSSYPLSNDEVSSAFLDSLNLIAKTQNLTLPAGGPEVVELHDHSPFVLTVSTEAVANGFYANLQALQGQRNTWWTGAAWNTQATAALYNFTEYEILPYLL